MLAMKNHSRKHMGTPSTAVIGDCGENFRIYLLN
jgi:hypothetical protein